MMGIKEIREILPHRYPFLLVDRIVEIEEGKSIRGYKNVSANEQFFQGHFPQEPVMPGVLILEAISQVGAVALSKNLEFQLLLFILKQIKMPFTHSLQMKRFVLAHILQKIVI